MPYAEHGEFVIVGVFAVSRELRSVHYQLLPANKTKRLTQFFPEMERRIFSKLLKNLNADWEKMAQTINLGAKTEVLAFEDFAGGQLFQSLTRPREGIVRQQARATILTQDIAQWIEDAFARMVYRVDPDASSPEEQMLVRRVQNYLTEWQVQNAWKRRLIGNNDYHATFPFTYQPDECEMVLRAIKPLFLGQKSSTTILDHGDFWLQKVRRLQQFKLAPELIAFPIERPDEKYAERADNAELVVSDLKKEGVQVIEKDNVVALKKLATISATEGTPLFSQGA